jgi:endonuclease/exonuclease/phosphatase (EEP) superfamily protein YafD
MLSKLLAVPAAIAALAGPARGDAEATSTAAATLTVMTYNVNYADRGRSATLDAIADGDADLVLLQETGRGWEKLLRKRFKDRYPHMVFHTHSRSAGALAVLSRHPITEDELLPAAEGWFPAQRITVDTPLGALDVLNLHLRPAIIEGSWIKGYFETPPIRLREITTYWDQLPRAPAIVAGDFNEEPGKDVGQFLAGKGMTRIDTGANPTSWSWSGTYMGQPVDLAMDIDHVVIDSTLAATSATVLAKGKSDHRPVLVTVTKAAAAP